MAGFADTVGKACDGFLARARAMPAAVVDEAAERIIARSPVGMPETWKKKPPAGYVPGQFRSNWNLGVDAIDRTTTTETNSFFLQGRERMPADPFGHSFYISNAKPYAWRLEVDAWSRQAPNGMVRLTAAEFSTILQVAARKVGGSSSAMEYA